MAERLVSIAAAVALLAVACGSAANVSTAGGSEPGSTRNATEVAAPDGQHGAATGQVGARPRTSGLVDCAGSRYDPDEFADAPPASSLPAGPAGAVDDMGNPAFDATLEWKVVRRAKNRVDLVRQLEESDDVGDGDVRTHERVILERVFGATNVRDGTWMLAAAGPCTPRLVADDGLGEADLSLARTPSPQDTTIDLLVLEHACVSGQTAEGRVELRDLKVTPKRVRVWIGVRPAEGTSHTCQGNPPTPYTIELDQPVGNRTVVDIGVVPPRPLNDAAGE